MTNQIPPILRNGDQGTYVERLQHELSQLGYQIGSVGVFDETTENVVKKFQQDYNLTVDGIVGPQTGRQIGVALASAKS
ncbi:peptidoglycan-binding domain-containing protein [Nostoc sp.]|uniref:peptidoglycan-binding domain-containing protein n=1 Tax=Nostoc sp. TaxID=1180 RepID=UPI002FF89D36